MKLSDLFGTFDIPWRHEWETVAGRMTVDELQAIRHGLETDDPNLLQGTTVVSDGGDGMCAACLVAYATWRGNGLEEWQDVHRRFRELTAGVNRFLNWFDWTDRGKAFAELLPLVDLEIARRKGVTCDDLPAVS